MWVDIIISTRLQDITNIHIDNNVKRKEVANFFRKLILIFQAQFSYENLYHTLLTRISISLPKMHTRAVCNIKLFSSRLYGSLTLTYPQHVRFFL